MGKIWSGKFSRNLYAKLNSPTNIVLATTYAGSCDVIPLPGVVARLTSDRAISCEINLQKNEFRVYSWNVRSLKRE